MLTLYPAISSLTKQNKTKKSDVIKQNQSQVGQICFNFSDWLCTSFAKLPFITDPIEIGQLVPEIQALVIWGITLE